MNQEFYVYILATRKDGPLYVGITTDLARRTWEHRSKTYKGFTARFNVDRLVYYEVFDAPSRPAGGRRRSSGGAGNGKCS
jgi:putative endonuclease